LAVGVVGASAEDTCATSSKADGSGGGPGGMVKPAQLRAPTTQVNRALSQVSSTTSSITSSTRNLVVRVSGGRVGTAAQAPAASSTALVFNGNPVSQPSLSGVNTVTSNRGNVIDITPSANHSVTHSTRIQGTANSSVDIINANGDVTIRRWFDSNGNQYRDVHFTNHGNDVKHPEWPHTQGRY